MQNSKEKQSISAKITAELKTKIMEQAKAHGQTTSEYVAAILTNVDQKEKQHKEEIEALKDEIKEKNELLHKVTDRLEQAQRALDQQQQLQLMAQRQVEELQRNQQLLLEDAKAASERKGWWQFWK